MLSKIKNISYVASNCIEFLVTEDYVASFIFKCKLCNLNVIETDPLQPLDPNFPDEAPDCNTLFQLRQVRSKYCQPSINGKDTAYELTRYAERDTRFTTVNIRDLGEFKG